MTSFYIPAIGTRAEVLGQLKNAMTNGNLLAEGIRDAIVGAIESEPAVLNPGLHYQGHEDRYSITIQGHSGEFGQPPVLSVTVQSRYIPKSDSA